MAISRENTGKLDPSRDVGELDDSAGLGRKFLFVGAPFGPFFRELGDHLKSSGARVVKVLLHGGDVLDWGLRDAVRFGGAPSEWRSWLYDYVQTEHVTDIIVFGDVQFYCRGAVQIGKTCGLPVHVFEEGYFRPHWITLERDGVNGRSSLPRDPDYYRTVGTSIAHLPPRKVGSIAPELVRASSTTSFVMYALTPFFLKFKYPYAYHPYLQCIGHTARFVRQKLFAKRARRNLLALIEEPGPLHLALLQRPGDSQLTHHSPFANQADYIDAVIDSFARCASENARLLFKAHPLDHGLERHEHLVRDLAAQYGVADRVFYVENAHLATLLRGVTNVITINSTAGLTAVEFGRATIALGAAIYNIPGLTFQGELDRFWNEHTPPDATLYKRFRAVVMARTQINGAYSTRAARAMALSGAAMRLLQPTSAHAARALATRA